MGELFVRGRLDWENPTMDFPDQDGDVAIRASWRDFSESTELEFDQLTYMVLPGRSDLCFRPFRLPVPFLDGARKSYHHVDNQGSSITHSQIELSEQSMSTTEACVAKIYPNREVRIKSDAPAYLFTMVNASSRYNYLNVDDWVHPEEGNHRAVWEQRPNHNIHVDGRAIIYPHAAAFRTPGWWCGQWNRALELSIGGGRFDPVNLRGKEYMHWHTHIMEPMIGYAGGGQSGTEFFFIADEEGDDVVPATPREEDMPSEYRGHLFPMREGDVFIPNIYVPHKVIFEDPRTYHPFWHLTLNYAADQSKLLHELPDGERVLLEAD